MNLLKWYVNKLKTSQAEISKLNLFVKKCPRCDSANINTVKSSEMSRAFKDIATLAFPLAALFRKTSKPLNVCRDCGFSWENR